MYSDCEGVVLRQTKTVNGRRMIVLFSKQYGKISAGTSISERGKNKTALALRPFSYGKYELFRSHETYSINGAETIRGFYQLGEDIDKFMCASYVLELTDRLLPEEQPSPQLFALLLDFFNMLENRSAGFETLVIGFQMKALAIEGVAPDLTADQPDERLSNLNKDDMDALRYIASNPLSSLERIALKADVEKRLRTALKSYYSYHLGIEKLKSESLII